MKEQLEFKKITVLKNGDPICTTTDRVIGMSAWTRLLESAMTAMENIDEQVRSGDVPNIDIMAEIQGEPVDREAFFVRITVEVGKLKKLEVIQ